MAEPHPRGDPFRVHIAYSFDRSLESKLTQAYEILVPCRERAIGLGVEELDHYARVSSEQQREENTIASQTASLIEFAHQHELEVPKEWVLEDEGYSGATLERPGLERVRDLAAEGQIQVVLAYSPDRLSTSFNVFGRKYAYQILLIEEFARCVIADLVGQGKHIRTRSCSLVGETRRR
jgi:hypothetical protein